MEENNVFVYHWMTVSTSPDSVQQYHNASAFLINDCPRCDALRNLDEAISLNSSQCSVFVLIEFKIYKYIYFALDQSFLNFD